MIRHSRVGKPPTSVWGAAVVMICALTGPSPRADDDFQIVHAGGFDAGVANTMSGACVRQNIRTTHHFATARTHRAAPDSGRPHQKSSTRVNVGETMNPKPRGHH
jgi:hypothetical protein